MSAIRSGAVRSQACRWRTAGAGMLVMALSSCSSILDFPQNVPMLNDGFGSPQLGQQDRTVERDAYMAMPAFGEIVVTLPAGTTMGQQPHGSPPVSLSYDKNRAGGMRRRSLGVRGVAPDADGVLHLPVPHIAGYHPTSLLVWVRTTEADGPRDMRVDFPLAETAVIDPGDSDRHTAFWRDQDGQCMQRGRVQPIEYADDTEATINGERHPFLFDTTLDGLCVFRFPQLRSIVETVTPGEVLRSPVRIRIPQVYQQQPQFRHVLQPAADAAPAGAER